jgi:hypothetical protein
MIMPFLTRIFLPATLLSLTTAVFSQTASLFDPYDCREKTELPIAPLVVDSAPEVLLPVIQNEPPFYIPDTTDLWKTWQLVDNFSFGKNRGALPMITDLQSLHPYFRDKVLELIRICRSKGIELSIVETYRTHAKQNEYKTLGKSYTNSTGGKSKHQYGLAVDVVPVVNGKPVWDNMALWKKIGSTGERLGLRWGGRWRKPFDPGHFEWSGGLTSQNLASGKSPVIPNLHDHYPCLEEDLKLLKKFWRAWENVQRSASKNTVSSGL